MKERIYMASPTMHGEEQKFVQEAFDTNWIAPLGKNVNEFEKELSDWGAVIIKFWKRIQESHTAVHYAQEPQHCIWR